MSDEPRPPYEEELRKLSLRAVVAFAARCARRAQSLSCSNDPNHAEVVEAAISAAAHFAAGKITAAAASAAASQVEVAAIQLSSMTDRYVAKAAAFAAKAARAGCIAGVGGASNIDSLQPSYETGAITPSGSSLADDVIDAATGAASAACSVFNTAPHLIVDSSGRDMAKEAERKDLARLAMFSPGPLPTLGDPIDVDKLGPLWPVDRPTLVAISPFREGSPWMPPLEPLTDHGAAAAKSLAHTLFRADTGLTPTLELLIAPGTATAEDLAKLFFEMSKLDRLLGGHGIDFRVVDAREPAFAEDVS
ncbi:MAG: hypothetical protein JW809_14835 [Pirellulales bacterium]|nr:hypothetical protein [Pirellulales bacterium]